MVKLKVNGKRMISSCDSLKKLKEEISPETDVVIYNGFQTAEDFKLEENDVVHFIKKGVLPSYEELESMMAARHTPQVHEKVKRAKVGIAGLGGLGSNIAIQLARTGIGSLKLVDFDVVEPSNLNRQNYFVRHLGIHKTEALKELIHEINPYIQVEIATVKVEESNACEIFKGCQIVCEAFDNPMAKAMLINTLLLKNPKVTVVSGSGMAGYESSNTIVTKKMMSRLYVCGDGTNEARVGNGLMAPRVSICAGHQANMVLRLLLGMDAE